MPWLSWPAVLAVALLCCAGVFLSGYWLLMDAVGQSIPVLDPEPGLQARHPYLYIALQGVLVMSLLGLVGVPLVKSLAVVLTRWRG